MEASKEAMRLSFSRAGAKGTGELGSLQRTRSRAVKAGEPNRMGGPGRVSTGRFQRGQRAGKGCKRGCNQGEQKTSRGAQYLGKPHLAQGVVMKTERQGLNRVKGQFRGWVVNGFTSRGATAAREEQRAWEFPPSSPQCIRSKEKPGTGQER